MYDGMDELDNDRVIDSIISKFLGKVEWVIKQFFLFKKRNVSKSEKKLSGPSR